MKLLAIILGFNLISGVAIAIPTDDQIIQTLPEWDGTTKRSEESSRYLAIMTTLNLFISHNFKDNAVNITPEQVGYAQKSKTFSTSVRLYQEWAKNGKSLPEVIKKSISSYLAKKTSDGRRWPLQLGYQSPLEYESTLNAA